jgi:hypothetical protein
MIYMIIMRKLKKPKIQNYHQWHPYLKEPRHVSGDIVLASFRDQLCFGRKSPHRVFITEVVPFQKVGEHYVTF